MSLLSKRLTALEQAKTPFMLDYLVMRNGFVYRRCTVLSHDEAQVFVSQEYYPESCINISEIASVRVVETQT